MSGRINFFNESISYTVARKGTLRKWILSTVEMEGKVAGDMNFILCNEEYLSELNYRYLKHKTLTDILTFPFDDDRGWVCGDIYISQPRVKENAEKFKVRMEDELHRVMIHGVLHLLGYHDSSKTEKAEMRKKEDYYLELLPLK
jgi:rRNA maturation RNase YbeY